MIRRPAARRTAWVVADQGLSSLTNFAVAIAIARSADQAAFGAFATAFLIYLTATIVVQGLVTAPLAVRASADASGTDPAGAAAGAALASGVLLGALVAAGGVAIGGTIGRTMLVFGIFLGPLLLQDAWRFVFFTAGRPRTAVANELVWIGGQTVFVGGAIAVGEPSSVTLTAAWAMGASLAALAGVHQSKVIPAVRRGPAFIALHRDLGIGFALAALVQFGSSLLAVLLIGAVVGVADVGAVRGAQTLFGPLTVVFRGVSMSALPEGSRLARRNRQRLPGALVAISVVLGMLAVVWGAVPLALGDRVGESLLGDTWAGSRNVILPITVGMIGMGVATGALAGLQILEAPRALFRLRLVAGLVTVVAAVAGAVVCEARGGAWGVAVGQCLAGVVGWFLLQDELAQGHRGDSTTR